MKRATLSMLGFCLALIAPAIAPARAQTATGELLPLLETARLEGRASGSLGGEVAARLRERGMTQPVVVTVQRLYRLRDAGCARLRVAFNQAGGILPGESAPKDRHAAFALNWCEGGRPPASEEGARPANQAGQP